MIRWRVQARTAKVHTSSYGHTLIFADCVADSPQEAMARIVKNDPLWSGLSWDDFTFRNVRKKPYLKFVGQQLNLSGRRIKKTGRYKWERRGVDAVAN